MLLSAATGRPTLAAVLPNSHRAVTGRPGPLGLPTVRSAVVLLVDGLGAQQLRSRAGHARHLTRGWPPEQTAFSFPSTTVAGLTSLTTGTAAGEHGLLAYTVYDRQAGVLRNQLSGWGLGMEPERWQLRPTVFERVRDEGRVRPVVVALPEYAESGLTRASLRGAEYLSADSVEERVETVLDLVEGDEPVLVYAYVAELDQTGHRHGWESSQWLEQLERLDAAVGVLQRELPGDTGLLITADHGMLDVPFDRQIELSAGSALLDGVVAIAGEPRARHLYLAEDAADGSAEHLVEQWRHQQAGEALAVTRQQAIAAGWYGDPRLVDPIAAARIGDVVAVAIGGGSYYGEDIAPAARLVLGQHGSITDAETIVPLIRRGAFAP